MTFNVCARVVVFLSILPLIYGCRPSTPQVAPEGRWKEAALAEHTQNRYDLRFRLNLKDMKENGAFRILAGGPKDDRFFVEIGPNGVFQGRIRNGEVVRGIRESNIRPHELDGAEIVFEQRPHRWALCANGRRLADGDEPPGTGLPLAFATKGLVAEAADYRFQIVPETYFSDGFMRTPDAPSMWTTQEGEWSVNALQDPLLSANAFQFTVKNPPESPEAIATALAGDWFWGDLNFSVACKPPETGAIGIIFCHRDEDEFLFRWTSRQSEQPVKQLIRRVDGVDTVLAQSSGGYAPGQWYTISATVGSGWVELQIDGASVLGASDPAITYGLVGLRMEGPGPAQFDDVLVEDSRSARVDFAQVREHNALISGGHWMPLAAMPNDPDSWAGGIVAESDEPALFVWGDGRWRDYSVSATLASWAEGEAGLCFRYQDSQNYYIARIARRSPPNLEIVRVSEGVETVLAAAPIEESSEPRRMSVATEGGVIVASLDGEPLLSTADYDFTRGRAGLYLNGLAGSFAAVTINDLPGATPIKTVQEAFAAEETMLAWSGAMSDWQRASFAGEDNTPRQPWWHRSDFHGDVRIEARLPELPPPGSELGLMLNGDGTTANGLMVVLKRPAEGNGPMTVQLLKDREEAQSAQFSWNGPTTLTFQRTGDVVCLLANGKPLFSMRQKPLEGRRVGWYAFNWELPYNQISLYSNNIVDYNFNAAPADWRVASGIWEVSNKWMCDPRWSFFSGRSVERESAALWNKRPLDGDFTIDYYVGNKMDNERGGGNYSYAQDMNITVCADGEDLRSGYSFLFGGFGNSVTCAYRGRERWSLPDGRRMILIDRGGLHRRWYHISVSRKGKKLTLRIDDQLVLEKEDPDMLAGKYWALWTHDNGIMVARVRVSAEGIGRRDSPDLVREPGARSIYGTE